VGLVCGTGFILRTRDFAESDLIVTWFTDRWGKRRVIAKQARRLGSRLGGVFDLLNQVEVVFYEKPQLDLVSKGSLLAGFPRMKRDLTAVTAALNTGRLLDRLLPLHHREERVYILFSLFLDLLEEGQIPTEQLHLATALKLLAMLGHRPRLDGCTRCGTQSGGFFFVPAAGGVLCSTCSRSRGAPITRGLALALHAVSSRPLARAGVIRFSPEEMERACKVVDGYIDHLIRGP